MIRPCTAFIAALLALAAPANAQDAATDLIAIAKKTDGICRGSSAEEKEALKLTYEICNIRADVFTVLLKMGWCYGKYNQTGSNMTWHRCTRGSQRGPFKKYNPETGE